MSSWVLVVVLPFGTSRQQFDEAPVSACVVPTLVPEPAETRYMTEPWAGTVALMDPEVVVSTCDHRLFSVYEVEDAAPAAAAVVEMVCALPFSLNSTTATSPLDSLRARTSSPLAEEISVPALPRESWSTATTLGMGWICVKPLFHSYSS